MSSFACLQIPSRISCKYKRCGLFVSGGFRAAHSVYSGVMLSTPSVLFSGYRVSFPGGTGQGVALTTPPPYLAPMLQEE
jgi:hypothetical protein